MPAPALIHELVERFDRNRDVYRSGMYNETQARREFIDPFFEALGWDVNNRQGYAEAYKDVIHEDAIKIGGATKAPDYCFCIGGTRARPGPRSCSRSAHLPAAIAQIENLGSLDTGSNTSVAAIRAQFGADFRIDLALPVELLLAGAERAGVVDWLKRTLAENAGGPLHIGFHLEPGYSLANCLAIHEELRTGLT